MRDFLWKCTVVLHCLGYWMWTLEEPNQKHNKEITLTAFFFVVHVYSGSCLKLGVISLVTNWPENFLPACKLFRSCCVLHLGACTASPGTGKSSAHHALLHLAADGTKCITCIQACNFPHMHLLSYGRAWNRMLQIDAWDGSDLLSFKCKIPDEKMNE